MCTVTYEFLLKPKDLGECHQTLSYWAGSRYYTNKTKVYLHKAIMLIFINYHQSALHN